MEDEVKSKKLDISKWFSSILEYTERRGRFEDNPAASTFGFACNCCCFGFDKREAINECIQYFEDREITASIIEEKFNQAYKKNKSKFGTWDVNSLDSNPKTTDKNVDRSNYDSTALQIDKEALQSFIANFLRSNCNVIAKMMIEEYLSFSAKRNVGTKSTNSKERNMIKIHDMLEHSKSYTRKEILVLAKKVGIAKSDTTIGNYLNELIDQGKLKSDKYNKYVCLKN